MSNIPGQIIPAQAPIVINEGCDVTRISVTNAGRFPVHLTAHYHVFEANPCLAFDRLKAWGMRLDVPANGSVRIEAGETVELSLVPIGGARVVRGFQGVVDGALDEADAAAALSVLIERGFIHAPTVTNEPLNL